MIQAGTISTGSANTLSVVGSYWISSTNRFRYTTFPGVTATSSSLAQVVDAWGHGFWELIPFTLQMALIIVSGYVLASSPPVSRVVAYVARLPRSARGATTMESFPSIAPERCPEACRSPDRKG